jgi:threonine/homoserine/homoserine lactone efflux protein
MSLRAENDAGRQEHLSERERWPRGCAFELAVALLLPPFALLFAIDRAMRDQLGPAIGLLLGAVLGSAIYGAIIVALVLTHSHVYGVRF